MLTELGKELRKIRIDRDEKLIEMAQKLDKSAAFISSIETGKKSPPSGFEEIVVRIYGLAAEAANKIRIAADRSRKAFVLEPHNALGRDTAGLMARRMNDLTASDLEEIRNILSRGTKPNE
ncbi:transcriptional regulator with XRE-family HTH domain [Sinorhizobium meliloti]|uniref:helix-turn-helix transcriptional regulator n=1 Tax=Rhizobium meliloti TaxID=382 RepID=UPI00036131E2|nr:helix-turn-helix transcriptional regulator [Sinorhizobium meliloti]MBP2466793.1 transcriptional regulator with XRE-family HTH domain [Sinorhizobium meliloti]MDE3765741.1 helix-turn-helix transcriptional regulator [Sinorhizobium meliloti]MDE3781635.1 helix-turn-helix transcriptional regulator [Sinorhizobium meliloti]MDE3783773.1 helix-turn-helix transcriptional regulator [Sinorhizobium meliloti]MDE3803603.1 helix-turn-helix transcriptional regulator [Sinorhizobium meliloti]